MVVGFAALSAVRGAVAIVGDSVKAASDLQQSIGGVEAVFGKYADGIAKKSKAAATAYGMSANEYNTNATLIGSLFAGQGVAMDQLGPKTDELIGRAADLSAMFGGTTTDAVGALSAAFKGEFDSIEKYGISLKQSDINAELAARGQDKLTGAALKTATQAAITDLVMGQSARAQGAFANESDTLAGKQARLAATFENVKATVGSALLPILTSLADFVMVRVIPAAQALGAWFGDNVLPKLRQFGDYVTTTVVPKLKEMGDNVANYLVPKLQALWAMFQANVLPVLQQVGGYITGTVVPAFVSLGSFIAENKTLFEALAVGVGAAYLAFKTFQAGMALWSAATKIYTAVQAALNAVMAMNPIGIIVLLIIGLVAALIYAYKNSETFRNIVNGVWQSIKDAVSSVLGWFTGTLWPGIMSVYNFIKDGVKAVFNFYVAVWSAIIGFIIGIPGKIIGFFAGIPGFFSRIWNAIKDFAVNGFNAIVGFVQSVPGRITGFFSNLGSFFSNVWNSIKDGAVTGFNNLVSFVGGIPGKILSVLGGVGSLLVNAGSNIIDGLLRGIKSGIDKIKSTLSGITDLIPDWKGPAVVDKKLLVKNGKLIIGGLVTGLESQYGKVQRSLGGLTNSVANTRFGSPAMAVAGAGGARGNINVTVVAPVGASSEDIGREIERHLNRWKKANGR